MKLTSVIFTGVIVLVLFSILFSSKHIAKEQKRARDKAKALTLNQFIPSFDALSQFVQEKRELNRGTAEGYLKYYSKVAQLSPKGADGHALEGLCYYFLGNYDQAINSLEKAVDLDPMFFWHHYNLGVVLFKKGSYELAAGEFQRAIGTVPQITLKTIYYSLVYRQIIRGINVDEFSIDESLKRGFFEANTYLAVSVNKLGKADMAKKLLAHNGISIESLSEIEAKMNLKVF